MLACYVTLRLLTIYSDSVRRKKNTSIFFIVVVDAVYVVKGTQHKKQHRCGQIEIAATFFVQLL